MAPCCSGGGAGLYKDSAWLPAVVVVVLGCTCIKIVRGSMLSRGGGAGVYNDCAWLPTVVVVVVGCIKIQRGSLL
jgi:hypothetical protein